MWLTAPSDLGASTRPAAADKPDSKELASASVSSRLRPDAARGAEIDSRSSSVSSPKFSSPSTNRRRPWSVGSRPAEVWGANSRPESVRSAMTLRMVAGDSAIGRRRARVRVPTGSPVSTYCSTISRRTAAERASSAGGIRAPAPGWAVHGSRLPTSLRVGHRLRGIRISRPPPHGALKRRASRERQ